MSIENEQEWVSVRDEAYGVFELPIVSGRLQASGIEAKVYESVIGGGVGGNTARFIKVRRKIMKQPDHYLERPNKWLRPTRGDALDSSRSRGWFYVAVPARLSFLH